MTDTVWYHIYVEYKKKKKKRTTGHRKDLFLV